MLIILPLTLKLFASGSHLACTRWNCCYRCLGPPAFFLSPTLSTVPLSIGHDNQQQRDPLRDLGPIHRWWCSEHCLLRLSPLLLFSLLPFHFGLIYLLISMIMLYTTFMSSCLCSSISMNDSSPTPHNHAYPYVSFLLTLTDIASSAVFSLHTAL